MIFLGRLDAFAWNILRHVFITVQYHQKSIALICIDRVSWKSRMHSSKELHPRTSKCQWCQFLMFDPTLALTDLRLALIFIFEIKATNKTIDFQILSFWVLDIQILKPCSSRAPLKFFGLPYRNAGGRSQEHGTEAHWWRGGKIQSAAAWGSNLKKSQETEFLEHRKEKFSAAHVGRVIGFAQPFPIWRVATLWSLSMCS